MEGKVTNKVDPNRIIKMVNVQPNLQQNLQLDTLRKKLQQDPQHHCPSKLEVSPDTICQCKQFRDKLEKIDRYLQSEEDPHIMFSVICDCGLFVGTTMISRFGDLPTEMQNQILAAESRKEFEEGTVKVPNRNDSKVIEFGKK